MNERVIICAGCRDAGAEAPGEAMARALAPLLPEGMRVETTECMIVCAAPVSVAFRASGKAAYLFSGVSAEEVGEIAAFARLYRDAEAGIVEDARPCGDLRFRLLGRIPA